MKLALQHKKHKIAAPTHRFFLLIAVLFSATALLAAAIYQSRPSYKSYTQAKVAGDEPIQVRTPPVDTTTPTVAASPTHDYTIPPVANGLAPVISRIPTSEKVVFLGIDDGANKQPFELQMMYDNNVKASLFLAWRFIKDNPSFFADFVDEGSVIEDHTLDHKLLSQLTYDEQKQEICGAADLYKSLYGIRPILFRPPGGDYNLDTPRAAAACGMKAVVLWDAKANGGSMQYQVGHSLRPGDIVLMHFRPEFKQDMQAFLDAQNSAGLHTELLEDWLSQNQAESGTT